MKGKFIVFEGIGGSGKTTQIKFLCEKMKSMGIMYEYIHFPVYDSYTGGIIKNYLNGGMGGLDEIPAEIPSLLYALNRYDKKDNILNNLEQGVHVLCDRYFASNMAFQSAKFGDKEERINILKWLESLDSRLPMPDITILFDIPISLSQELINNRGDKDIHEEDVDYQKRIRNVFLNIARNDEKWHVINCSKNNNMKSIEKIHDEVWNYIKNII